MTLLPHLQGPVASNFEAGQIKPQQTKSGRSGQEGEEDGESERCLTDRYNKFDFVNLSSQISQLLFFPEKANTEV